MSDKCPFCGDEGGYGYSNTGQWGVKRQFDCGTRLFNDGIAIQDDPCKDRQISTLQAQLADREEKLALYKIWMGAYMYGTKEDQDNAFNDLIAKGEL